MSISEVLQLLTQCFEWDANKNNSWMAFLVFACGGVGIGTFESNVLNVMSLVSPGARYFSVIGIPVGVNVITIFSFLIIAGLDGILKAGYVCVIIFCLTIAMMIVATIILFVYVPHGSFINKKDADYE